VSIRNEFAELYPELGSMPEPVIVCRSDGTGKTSRSLSIVQTAGGAKPSQDLPC
jgi:hypothetical protein